MVINRYNSEAQLAKFNPLSADEVMKVPILKQGLEDKQLSTNTELLKGLYAQKSVEADNAVINQKKEALKKQLDVVAGEIASKGVSRQRTEAFRKLKLDYDQQLSISGDIGHANEYAAKKELAKKNFYALSAKSGWSKQQLDNYWADKTSNSSAFNSDGSFINDFAEVGVPINNTISSMFNNIKIGTSPHIDKYGNKTMSNYPQLANAAVGIKLKFNTPGTNEFEIAKMNGWSKTDIEELLQREVNSRVIGKPIKTSSGNKAEANALRKASEHYRKDSTLSLGEKTMIAANVMKTSERKKTLEDLKLKISDAYFNKNMTEVQKFEQEYQTIKDTEYMFTSEYNKTVGGAALKKNLDDAEKAVSSKGAVEFMKVYNNLDEYNKKHGLAYKEKDGKYIIDKWIKYKTYKKYTISKKDFNNLDKARAMYNNGLDNEISDLNGHIGIASMQFIVPSDPAQKRYYKTYMENMQGLISNGGPSMHILGAKGLDSSGEEQLINSNNVNKEIDIKNALKRGTNLKVIRMTKGSGSTPAGVTILIDMPTKSKLARYDSAKSSKTIEVRIGFDLLPASKAKEMFTKGLAKFGTADAKRIAADNELQSEHAGFIPSHDNNENYYNTDDLKREFKRYSGAATVLGLTTDDKKRSEIYQGEDGLYKMKISDNRKKGMDVTYSTIFSNKDVISTLKKLSPSFQEMIDLKIREMLNAKGTPINNNELLSSVMDDSEIIAIVKQIANSNEVIKSENSFKLINIFR